MSFFEQKFATLIIYNFVWFWINFKKFSTGQNCTFQFRKKTANQLKKWHKQSAGGLLSHSILYLRLTLNVQAILPLFLRGFC